MSCPRPLTRAVAAVLAFPAVFGASALAQDPPPADTTSAGAAAQQLDVGDQWFRARCIECHDDGTLSNADFQLKWTGQSAFDLFELIRTTMPEDEPGALTRGTYTSIVAYLMRINGMPVGTTALPSDSAALTAVRLSFVPSVAPTR